MKRELEIKKKLINLSETTEDQIKSFFENELKRFYLKDAIGSFAKEEAISTIRRKIINDIIMKYHTSEFVLQMTDNDIDNNKIPGISLVVRNFQKTKDITDQEINSYLIVIDNDCEGFRVFDIPFVRYYNTVVNTQKFNYKYEE
jgi:hypothetical protein